MTSKIAHLGNRALISVRGPDARSFLNNLLTQDVLDLVPGAVRFAGLLSPPGRLLFDLFIIGETDGISLDVDAGHRDALMQRLSMYRLRAQVEIAVDARSVFTSWPDVAEGFIADPRTALLGGRTCRADCHVTATADDWEAHRLNVGIPDPTHDTGQDKTYPIEANFDLLNGIDFAKGCFVGQETTSRMKRRGEIRKRMLPVAFDGPAPLRGAEVLNGDLRVGEVLTGRTGMAMALVRLDRLKGNLTVDGRPVAVRWPVWMPR
jgi:folate-binding protein YgfZ